MTSKQLHDLCRSATRHYARQHCVVLSCEKCGAAPNTACLNMNPSDQRVYCYVPHNARVGAFKAQMTVEDHLAIHALGRQPLYKALLRARLSGKINRISSAEKTLAAYDKLGVRA